jgi:hypothetical protein
MEFMKLNHDDKRRCEIMGITHPVNYMGGCYRFEGLTLDQLNLLLNEAFIDPEEAQNNAPTTAEFKSFLESYPETTLHGYMISPDREDYRMTIEGAEYNGEVSKEMAMDFVEMFRFADDFTVDDNCLYCWFD